MNPADALAWLIALPKGTLYLVLAAAAFVENIFPPLPADTVIALGAFVAAQGPGSALGVWSATMVGNIGGAMCMYALGRRFGLPWLERTLPRLFPPGASERITRQFATQGLFAVAVSRLLPAVRAVVPPVAGALRIPAMRAFLAMALPSALWYGALCLLAFRAGVHADALLEQVAAQQRLIGAGAVVAALVLAVVWFVRRRQASTGA